jgi:hypothetical protein
MPFIRADEAGARAGSYGAAMPYPYPAIVPPEQRMRLAREHVALRLARRRRRRRSFLGLARVARA